MTSSEQLGGDHGGIPALYYNSIAKSRSSLADGVTAKHSSLDSFIGHARAIANSLGGFGAFLEEDSRPKDPAKIRDYMMQEMTALWNTRKQILEDLKLFSNQNIIMALSRTKERAKVIDECIGELDSIRGTVKGELCSSRLGYYIRCECIVQRTSRVASGGGPVTPRFGGEVANPF